jgi:hypothetical protein
MLGTGKLENCLMNLASARKTADITSHINLEEYVQHLQDLYTVHDTSQRTTARNPARSGNAHDLEFGKAGENNYYYEGTVQDVDTPIETLMEVHQTDQHRPFLISPARSSFPEILGSSPRKINQLGIPFPKRE